MIWNHLNKNPSQKFCKNLIKLEKLQIFQQTQKVRSQKMKCMRKGVKKNHTRERKWSWDRRESGEVIWSERERCLGRWEVRKDWERSRRNVARTLFIEILVSRWIKRCRELSRIKTREIAIKELLRCYREVSTANKLRWIEKLSSIYQASRNFLDRSSSYWEAIEIES